MANKNILNLFKKLRLKKNDNILIHSNMGGMYQFKRESSLENICESFFLSLKNYIGPKGTVLIPAYNYKFTKGKKYNRFTSPSEVGELGNWLIDKFPLNRTLDPVFNHFVFGRYKSRIFNCSIDEAFGEKSIFNLIFKKNFKIICFCCSPKVITFLHFIEKKFQVNYRYNKIFLSKIFKNKKNKLLRYKYYVGKKNIDYSIKEKKVIIAIKKKVVKANFGRFACYCISTKNLYKSIQQKIKKTDDYLIK